jgi:SAM-dependent methyltransferase
MMRRGSHCRSCGAALGITFVDLGLSPLSNSYIGPSRKNEMEPFYPLHAYVCEACFLVQVDAFETPERIFSQYAYFSSYSDSWLRHSRAFASEAVAQFRLTEDSLVVEAASNDGYLLQYFQEAGVRVLGIEPAMNIAKVARARGIPTESVFLGAATGQEIADRYGQAKLVVANNVIAHVPDVHDFFAGLKRLAAPDAVVSVEFPQLLSLIRHVQFDTIYHEHFSYYSLYSLERLLERHDFVVFDVRELPTHGGSLRVMMRHRGNGRARTSRVALQRAREEAFGIAEIGTYRSFGGKVAGRKREILRFLIEAADRGKRVVGYGAPAKGNTLLNYCGVREDLLAYTVDRNPEKQGTFLPGSRIPVYGPELYEKTKPDYIFILPWNLREEIVEQTRYARRWGAQYVVAVPELEVF